MPNNTLTVRIGGDSAAGGIVTTGEVFARIAAYAGLEVYTTRTVPAEIKGGHVMFQARIAPTQVWSQGDDLDMLVAFDQESIDRYYAMVRSWRSLGLQLQRRQTACRQRYHAVRAAAQRSRENHQLSARAQHHHDWRARQTVRLAVRSRNRCRRKATWAQKRDARSEPARAQDRL